jgi:hypothetical protein
MEAARTMTMDVKGAWAGNALWPDSSTTRKSNTDYDALARRAAADDVKTSVSTGQVAATKKATPSGFTQDDFALATRFGQDVLPQSLQQLTGLQKIERQPWHGVDRAASNPYGNIMDSLRRAALRRDAAAPAVPATDTAQPAAEQPTESAATPSPAVSTAIAAYTAAVESAPVAATVTTPPAVTTEPSPPSSTTETTSSGDTTSSGGTTSSGATTSSGGPTSTGGTASAPSGNATGWWKHH